MALTYERLASGNLTAVGPTTIYSGPASGFINFGWVLNFANKGGSAVTAIVWLNDGTADRQLGRVELDASGGFAEMSYKQAIGNGHAVKVELSAGSSNVDYYLSALKDG